MFEMFNLLSSLHLHLSRLHLPFFVLPSPSLVSVPPSSHRLDPHSRNSTCPCLKQASHTTSSSSQSQWVVQQLLLSSVSTPSCILDLSDRLIGDFWFEQLHCLGRDGRREY